MSTNYYVIKKKDFNKEQKLYNILENHNPEILFDKIKNLFTKEYKTLLNELNESELELYEDNLEEEIQNFLKKIKYNVNEDIIKEDNKIHIGKSSAGWLFNFQTQYREECAWGCYEDVVNWLKRNTQGRSASYIIVDEYNRKQTLEEFIDLVDTKQKDPRNLSNPDNFTHCRNVNGYRFSDREFS